MKPYNMLTEQDKLDIISHYNAGMYIPQVAETLQVSERGVSRVLKEANIYTLRKNRYTLNEHYFSRIDTERKAYLLGFIAANGYVDERNYIVIQLTEEDLPLLQEIANEIEFTGDIRYIEPQANRFSTKGCYRLAFSSQTMANDLYKLGLSRAKSKHLESLPQVDESLMRHLVRGYFDGDGSITVTKHTTQKYAPSPTLSIIATLGVLKEIRLHMIEKCGMTGGYIKGSRTEEMKYLEIRGNKNALKIYHYLYDNASIYLDRKHEKFRQIRPLREATCVSKSGETENGETPNSVVSQAGH